VIWLEDYAAPVAVVWPLPGGAAGVAAMRGAEPVILLGAAVPCRRAAVGEA
jgi:hypothetical protein